MYHKMQKMVGTYKFSTWVKANHELCYTLFVKVPRKQIMPKIFEMVRSSSNNLLSHCKPILQIYNGNNASKIVSICNNLDKPVILVRVSSSKVFHLIDSFVFLNTDGWHSFPSNLALGWNSSSKS